MADLLSLPSVLIELVVKQIIRTQEIGLRDWCRAASTCKRLWSMQLPGEAIEWSVNLDIDIQGGIQRTLQSLPAFDMYWPSNIMLLMIKLT